MSASDALSDALSALGHWHFESSQMSTFILNARTQIELASGFSLAELRATVERIKAGDTPIGSRIPSRSVWSTATADANGVIVAERRIPRSCGHFAARSAI